MLNFTGTTKKRVVNLGDARGGNKGKSFLEQAKKDRQQRELARKREKSAILLQLFIRRCLDLRINAANLSKEWLENGIGNDPTRWCVEASFIIRFGSGNLLEHVYPSIYTTIDSLNGAFSSYNVAALVQALNKGLGRGISTHLALACLLRLFALYPLPKQTPEVFKSLISNVMKSITTENISDAIQLIFKVNCADSVDAFIRFLSQAPRGAFLSSAEFSKIVLGIFKTNEALITFLSLSDKEQVSLLINVVTLNSSPFSDEDLFTHATILSRIHIVIVPEQTNDGHEILTTNKVTVSHENYQLLLTLLSSNYVRQLFRYLRQMHSTLCFQTITQLLYIFPYSRTSLCMILSIITDLPNWIYHLLSGNPRYALHLPSETKNDLLSLEMDDAIDVSFEDLIYTYNQILSSWLVVSKDTESFQSGSFPLEDIKMYSLFLKSFCFSLIKGLKFSEVHKYKDLKEISISVLNQLYIKNLRLQFLPNLLWQVKGLELHLREIALDIEPEENGDSSDEEDNSDRLHEQSKQKSIFRPGSQASVEREILNKVPFFVDFTTRVKIFQNSIRDDRSKFGPDSNMLFFSEDVNLHKLAADISRESVLDDAFDSFFKLGENFKNELKVSFFNEHGPEAGIDGGGLTKEFLTSVVSEGFSPKNELALFKESSSYNLYPNDDIFWKTFKKIDLPTQRKRLMYTKFLGMIIGKCLYEGILIDVSFAPSFLSKWRVAQNNLKNSIDDLVFLDPELYANLNKLLDMNEDQLQSLDLNFTIDAMVGNQSLLFDLQPPNGSQETVTLANRLSYIHRVSHFKLNQSLHLQTKSFLDGLFEIISPNWLNMFDPLELQMLISGGHDIDLEDWKMNVHYGGYFDDDLTVKLFWEVVEEMTSKERCDLVKFVTSVSRAPLLGFGVMRPKFGISNAGSPDRLPTASTCLNLLKLPDYRDKALIRQKLLYSISANSGFDLS